MKGDREKSHACHTIPFDFAQQVHFPFSAQQTGPETARKCGIFGVCNDGENKQVTYFIDKAENPRKGADCVISLVHHYLEHHGAGEKNVYLHADNCVGIMQYLMWRVITGRHESAELSFMLVRHTKFSPDRFFVLFKKAFYSIYVFCFFYGTGYVCTVFDIAQTVQPMHNTYHNSLGIWMVLFKQWSAHLASFLGIFQTFSLTTN